MHKTQRLIPLDSYRDYVYRVLALVGFFVLLLISNASFALVPNPGAMCSADYLKDSLSSSDYPRLISSWTSGTPEAIVGANSSNIPLKIKVTKKEFGTNVVNERFSIVILAIRPSISLMSL